MNLGAEKMQSSKEHVENSTSPEYMLEEYKMLRERFHSLRDEAIIRMNFFLTLTSAIIGGILIIGNNISPILVRPMLLAALVLLAGVGIDVVNFMVTRDEVTDRVERGMSRVRRYFTEREPLLKNFIVYPDHDEPTNYVVRQKAVGLRRTAQLVQSFTVGLAIGICSDLLGMRLEVSVILSLVALAINFSLLERNARHQLTQALNRAKNEVRFPKSS
jgi:hypothetical protein